MPAVNNTVQDISARRAALDARFQKWPRNTIASHFYEACMTYPERIYIHADSHSITYKETWESAKDYAKALLQLGVRRRDHVAILMENDVVYPALMIACSMVGAVFIPINTMLSKNELQYILTQSDARFLIMHQATKNNRLADSISALLHEANFKEDSQLQDVICIPNHDETIDKQFTPWDEFYKKAERTTDDEWKERWGESRYPDEVGAIIYTSGSTGTPKGVMLTDDMLLRSAYSTCMSRAIEDGRVTYAPLPFYHCYNLIEGILAMSFVGGLLVAPKAFSPIHAMEMIEKYKANDFLLVPTMLVPFLNHPKLKEYDLSSLFAMWCGAAPAPVPVWKKAIELLGLTEIITGYGQSEVASSGVTTELGISLETLTTRVGRPKLGGVSGLPEFNGSNVEYKTVDIDTKETLPHGSIGELAVRGATVTHGYYKKPEETEKVIDKDGWLLTGDVGRIDENGYIELIGRSKEMYKVSGELVSPREVEGVISKHPMVDQVAVIGVPDTVTTEAGVAFIELKGGETCTRRDILNWCSESLARFKVPRHVWFIESADWPLTSTGKVQKFRLKEMAEKRLAARGR
ncbi:class I adenylate-forming enzyme family protein [Oceanobacillus kapialis]|uniref:class I adenylate-forming enzyme family protein n=1 Tax=Oceanobacillus kapialis TaxID=481353 RepID=UPI00384CF7CF